MSALLPDGHHPLPPGKLASVVTFLEMTARPPRPARPFPRGVALRAADRGDVRAYRRLYAAVGGDHLWFSRLAMPDDELAAVLADPAYEPLVLERGGEPIGILDLDFREPDACELAFLGLVPAAVGTGLGLPLVEAAVERAWARPVARLWVHTCTWDHPNALGVYRQAGFVPTAVAVEVHDDPRLTGRLPREACARAPLLEHAANRTVV